MPPEVIEKFKNMPSSKEKEEISELPRWVKTALVKHELYGLTFKQAAKDARRSGETLRGYAKSPAAKKWREQLREFADDPIEIAKAYLKGNALNISLDRIAFLDMAKSAGDYAAADKIAADLQDRIGITKKRDKSGDGSIVVKLQLPGGGAAALEPAKIEAEWEEVEEEGPDVEIVDE